MGPFLSPEPCIDSHLDILKEGSKVEERHLDRSIELCLSHVQELFEGRHSLQVVFSPLLRLAHAGILQQQGCSSQKNPLQHKLNHTRTTFGLLQSPERRVCFTLTVEKGLFTCLTWTKSSRHRPFISRSCCLSSRETVSSHVSMRKLPASFMAAC